MHTGLLLKVAFWLMVIGLAALLAPNPAWPEYVARFVLSLASRWASSPSSSRC